MPPDTVWAAAGEVPPEWYGGDLAHIEALVEKLLARRNRIRDAIQAFARSDRNPFPNWGHTPSQFHSVPWRLTAAGDSIN